MIKKIFSIFGIILGSVIAFVGAVVGVMAAMGKFKTPIVFPTQLVFLDNDVIVLEKNAFDTSIDWTEQISLEPLSIQLRGTSSEKHEVNKKTCYIWFYQNVGADLITLCDENGQPLVKDNNNRYKVNCNEPIYYHINKVASDYETDGKVMLMARSENNKVQTNEPLTFWIDREIKGVFLNTDDAGLVDLNNNHDEQEFSVGSDFGLTLNYKVDTPLSLKPISKESAKEIELYYVTPESDDYIKVTESSVAENHILNSIFTVEDGVFVFKTALVDEYSFKIAAFPTYKSKIDYETSIDGLQIQNPNYHRTQNMVVTSLKIRVNPVEVSEAGFMSQNVVFNLYSDNDYITLDGVSGVTGAKDNNLEMYMKKGQGSNIVSDYSRFDEVSMDILKSDGKWIDKTPMFVSSISDTNVWMYKKSEMDKINIVGSKIFIDETKNLEIINYITVKDKVEDGNYYSSNGVAVHKKDTNEILLLNSGGYLNFYVKSKDEQFSLSNFDFEAELVQDSAGRTKSWKIVAQEIPDLTNGTVKEDDDLELCLGILVVNNSGLFKVGQFFDTISVVVKEVPLSYTLEQKDLELNVEFSNGGITESDPMPFDNIVKNVLGSYNSLVFVIKENLDGYIVETTPSIKFVIGEVPYVLVGRLDDGSFVNEIAVNKNVTSSNKNCEILLLQLKNGINETAASIIGDILKLNPDGRTFEEAEDNSIIIGFCEDKLNISAKYILNPSLLKFKYDDNGVSKEQTFDVYENTSAHKIEITCPDNADMLPKIVEFYSITKDSFIPSRDNILITSYDFVDNIIAIEFEAKKSVNEENAVVITLKDVEETLEFPGIKVLKGSPDEIILNLGIIDGGSEQTQVELSKDVLNITETLDIVLEFKDGKYSYNFKYKGYDIPEGLTIFNTETSLASNLGFQGDKDKGQKLDVKYDSSDKNVFNTNESYSLVLDDLIKRVGETILSVTIGETTRYLQVNVSAPDFKLETYAGKTNFDIVVDAIKTFNLNEKLVANYTENMLVYSYKESDIDFTKNNKVYIDNVKCVSYGDGVLNVSGNAQDGWALKKDGVETPALTITDNGSGWQFAKSDKYVTLTVSFDVVTVNQTKTITLTFTSNVAVNVNDVWNHNRIFYAGTSVLLYSPSDTSAVPVFTSTSSDISFKINGEAVGTDENYTFNVPEDLINEDIKIEILISNSPIRTIVDFEVKPNVVAEIQKIDKTIQTEDGEKTIKVNKTFTSETSYDINKVYNLTSYKASHVYGSSAEMLYFVPVYYTDDTYLTESATTTEFVKYSRNADCLQSRDTTDLTIAVENTSTLLIGGETLDVGKMEEIGKTHVEPIALVYSFKVGQISKSCTVLTSDIEIENIYQVSIEDKTSFQALMEHYSFVTIKYPEGSSVALFKLEDVICGDLEISVNKDKTGFTIATKVAEDLTNVQFTLVFKNADGQVLKFVTEEKYTITPYKPDERADKQQAYSGRYFDFLNGIYNANNNEAGNYIVNDINIKSLVVSRVLDAAGNDITSSIVNGTFTSQGYIKGEQEPNCNVLLKEIKEDKLIVWIEYVITYNDGTTYTYPRELEIFNRQEIAVKYPETDLELSSGLYKFKSGYEQDGAKISGDTLSNDGIYTIKSTTAKPIHYEPVMIYTDSSYELDFSYDSVKEISRANVSNRGGIATTLADQVLNITLIGYENYYWAQEYAGRVVVNYETNKVILPQAAQGLYCNLIFKLETVSGNYKYYFVYIYCVGSISNFNVENNLNVVACNGILSLNNNPNMATAAITTKTTYVELIQTVAASGNVLFTTGAGESVTFASLFGKPYNSATTNLYLYNITTTGVEDQKSINYNDKQWKKVADGDKILLDEHFNTITLGLVFSNVNERYVYGTITIYVQPTNAINVDTGEVIKNWSYSAPNGMFTADVEANATQIASPFGETWAASIVSIDNIAYNAENQDFKVESSATSLVKLNKRVAKDTLIVVKYSYNGTIAYVTYTYKATVIPESSSVGIGEFVKSYVLNTDDKYDSTKNYYTKSNEIYSLYSYDKSKWNEDWANLYIENFYFNNEVVLKSGNDYNSKFFGTYEGKYEVEVVGENAPCSYNSDKLTFTQSTEKQTVNVKMKYTDYKDEEIERTFTFVVEAGISFDERKASDSGLTAAERKNTVLKDYTSAVGSTLNVGYKEISVNLFKYTIGGLDVYTDKQSKLKLTFDVNNYVLLLNKDDKYDVLGVGDAIEVSGTYTLNFPHSAQNIAMKMSIQPVNSSNEAFEIGKDFYINVIQTYSRLKSVYLVDGADHENVASYTLSGDTKTANSIVNLHSKLLNAESDRYRIKLLGTTIDPTTKDYVVISDANLINMGFQTEGNPNYIEFTVDGNATIKNNSEIKFNEVTKNTLCNVFLNNKAGIETNSVWYTYQIMASNLSDGMNYDVKAENRYYAESDKYITFAIDDKEAGSAYESSSFVVGSMLDERNDAIFNVSVNGVTFTSDQPIIIDENNKSAVGEYTNGIQYSFDNNDYKFYLTFDTDNNKIEFILTRMADKGVLDGNMEIIISIGGVNGATTVVNELKIVFSNYQVSSKFEDTTDASVFSGYVVKLNEKFNGDSDAIKYQLAESKYYVDGKEKTISANETDNNLFKYNSTEKTLLTKAVGTNVEAEVKFVVVAGNYQLKEITYNFRIRLNMQFIVNGEELVENATLETNFVLHNSKDQKTTNTGNFPIEINYISGEKIETNVDSNYYSVLAFDLYRLNIQNNAAATQKDKLMSRENTFNVELYSNIENGILSVSKNGIKFNKDYSGELELKLSVKTDNGTYYEIWTIYVHGIKDLQYSLKDSEYGRLLNSSLPFNSGTKVDLINTQRDTGVGILMSNAPRFASTDVRMNISYSYTINELNTETTQLSNKELFSKDENYDHYQGGGSGIGTENQTENKLSIYLPSVPSATEDVQQSYLVTYKVYVEYLGLEYDNAKEDVKQEVKIFYVSYRVINYQQISEYSYTVGTGTSQTVKSSADINVDDLSGNHLKLFYFTETYTVGTKKYKFTYDGEKVKLTVDDSSYDCGNLTETDSNIKTFGDYSYNIQTKKLYEKGEQVAEGKWSKDINENNTTVLAANFDNIFEYAEFISKFLNVETSSEDTTPETTSEDPISVNRIEIGTNIFTLKKFDGSTFGVDLAECFVDDARFENELKTELKIVENNVATVTVVAYSETNTNGFRLTTNSKIEAKLPVKISQIISPNFFKDLVASDDVTINTAIVGIGEPNANWMKEGLNYSSISKDTTAVAQIVIQSDISYKIKKVTYSAGGSSSDKIYILKQDFYYIDASEVVVPDYGAVGIETTFFKVAYMPNSANNVVLDLTKGFKVWKTTSGETEGDGAKTFGDVLFNDSEEIKPTYDSTSKAITIGASTLDAYKKSHPNKTNYPTITAQIYVNSKLYSCEIVYALPDYVTVDASYADASHDLTVSLIGQVCVPVKVNGTVEYQLLADDLSKKCSIYETEYLKSYENGILTFDTTKISDYFYTTDNKELRILCELTTQDGTLEFEVVVEDTRGA